MKDEDAFREFAHLRTPTLLRAAYLLCGNHHEAEDLVQETLAKVYVVWGRKRLEHPVAYARTTLTRTFISTRRLRRSTERPTDEMPDVVAAGSDTDLRLDLVAALGRLPKLDRAVLVLRHLEDTSVADTADALGLSEQAVRTRSLRALKKLRDLMGDQQPRSQASTRTTTTSVHAAAPVAVHALGR
ncbi:SigE family RNA polymerase sigma factor [Nocardioides yefusunii]|uniref:SigE family RNA polymerase sigma factor n=1 Tax=Nocardioides yefusunii TaxID=2500546 RepID=A0ABW1R1N3_9ACTN|nr:SigE family RNA polymerase sigma factor [Nocardioides yefusunii]